METASFNGFLRTVLEIIAFWYVFKFLARIFFPILVRKAVSHAEQNFNRQFNQDYSNQHYRNSEPDVTIDTSKAAKPRETKKVGEYVDYEEID
jgi:DNA integrity scanning protein DisA with diadenylate cyclase activity